MLKVKDIVDAYDFGRPLYVRLSRGGNWRGHYRAEKAAMMWNDGTFRNEYDEIVFNSVDEMRGYAVYSIGTESRGLVIDITPLSK